MTWSDLLCKNRPFFGCRVGGSWKGSKVKAVSPARGQTCYLDAALRKAGSPEHPLTRCRGLGKASMPLWSRFPCLSLGWSALQSPWHMPSPWHPSPRLLQITPLHPSGLWLLRVLLRPLRSGAPVAWAWVSDSSAGALPPCCEDCAPVTAPRLLSLLRSRGAPLAP